MQASWRVVMFEISDCPGYRLVRAAGVRPAEAAPPSADQAQRHERKGAVG